MAYQIVEIGTAPNDGTGDPLRTAFTKLNANFAQNDTALATLSTTVAGKIGSASPALSGTPTAPTAAAGTNTTQLATTAFVTGALGAYTTAAVLAAVYAPLASPGFTGTPTAPSPSVSDNTTRLATTAMVQAAIGATPPLMPAGSSTGSEPLALYTANAALTTQIPLDDTIPQITEGTQVLSVTHACLTASNRVNLRFQGQVSVSAASWVIAALFVDGAANAVRTSSTIIDTTNGGGMLTLEYEASPGDTASHTYTLRVGPSNAVTVRLNGSASARFFGGSSAGTLKLNEIKA